MTLKLFTISTSINNFFFGLLMPFFIIYLTEYVGISLATFGVLIAISGITSNVLLIPFNWIGDKWTRKPLLILAGFGGAFVLYRFTTFQSIDELYLLMLIGGVFSAMGSVGEAFVADLTKGVDRGKKFGIFAMVTGIGSSLAVIIGANAIEVFGFIPLFYVVAISSIANAVVIFFVETEEYVPRSMRVIKPARVIEDPAKEDSGQKNTPKRRGGSLTFKNL